MFGLSRLCTLTHTEPSKDIYVCYVSGAAIKPSLAGATSGSNAGQAGSGSIGLVDVDLDVCTESSTMHTVRALLVPDDITLPDSAEERSENATEIDVETVTENDIPGVHSCSLCAQVHA